MIGYLREGVELVAIVFLFLSNVGFAAEIQKLKATLAPLQRAKLIPMPPLVTTQDPQVAADFLNKNVCPSCNTPGRLHFDPMDPSVLKCEGCGNGWIIDGHEPGTVTRATPVPGNK
jgi:hypothetical protein